jgi:hypothetical protein
MLVGTFASLTPMASPRAPGVTERLAVEFVPVGRVN